MERAAAAAHMEANAIRLEKLNALMEQYTGAARTSRLKLQERAAKDVNLKGLAMPKAKPNASVGRIGSAQEITMSVSIQEFAAMAAHIRELAIKTELHFA